MDKVIFSLFLNRLIIMIYDTMHCAICTKISKNLEKIGAKMTLNEGGDFKNEIHVDFCLFLVDLGM